MTTPQPTPEEPDHPVLGYRSRATNPAPKVGPSQWLTASLVFGGLSWMTAMLMCAGVGSRLAWLPASLAGAGLVSGVVAAVQHLPSDATEDVFVAMFMNFVVVALWVLVIAVL